MAINIPLKNCLKKFCLLCQSSNTKMRECSLWVMVVKNSPNPRSNCFDTCTTNNTKAEIKQMVCRVSVHTMVLIPLRCVYNQIRKTATEAVSTNGTCHASKITCCKISVTRYNRTPDPIVRDSRKKPAPVLYEYFPNRCSK